MSWLEDLEARLEQQLEQFLQTNPAQEALLADQERRDRLERLRLEQLTLQGEAERARQELLALAAEIHSWQERVERARAAAADDLAIRAQTHVGQLMEQGRWRWQQLAELGVRFAAVERELQELQTSARPNQGATGTQRAATASASRSVSGSGGRSGSGSSLEQDWADFEADQALEQLRRRQG